MGVQAASAVEFKPETSPICPFLAPLTGLLLWYGTGGTLTSKAFLMHASNA